MPTNPYTQSLEDELALVKAKRWRIRKTLEDIANGARYSRDEFDMRRLAQDLQREFAYLEREHQRLHHELGRPLPHQGSIKLDYRSTPTPVRRSGTVDLRFTKRTIPSGFMHRAILGPGR
jgi:hypothetical protein